MYATVNPSDTTKYCNDGLVAYVLLHVYRVHALTPKCPLAVNGVQLRDSFSNPRRRGGAGRGKGGLSMILIYYRCISGHQYHFTGDLTNLRLSCQLLKKRYLIGN